VCAPIGFKAAALKAGLRATGTRADCALVVADEPALSAGVFTKNMVAAAPVLYCKETMANNARARAVLVNAGQANAATGTKGMEDSVASANAVAAALGIDASEVLLESTGAFYLTLVPIRPRRRGERRSLRTFPGVSLRPHLAFNPRPRRLSTSTDAFQLQGVIGKRIKMPELLAAVPTLAANLSAGADAAAAAATAICTTDLVRKSIAIEVDLGGGRRAKIGGMGKGSGMIHPNMATMLGVITTDANVDAAAWKAMLKRAATNSFNQISVDGDTSTNDTVIGLASAAAGGDVIEEGSKEAATLERAVEAVCVAVAKSIAWDGEGATCLIECVVTGATSDADARRVARSVISSSLVKSAVFGHDPNWGRLAAAAGYAGVDFEQSDLRIALGPHVLMERGQPLDYDAVAASAYLKETTGRHGTVTVDVSVGGGGGAGTAWGCDLTYDYVKINAEYTT